MPFVGQNKARSGGWTETGEYDEGRYQYGGYAGGARDERANLNYRQGQVEGREGPRIDRTEQNQTRGVQMGSLGKLDAASIGRSEDMQLLGSAARGTAPSRAEVLGQQMSDRALRAQVSAAGTVRGGPGAQAAAYRSAAQNAALQRAEMNQGIQAERAAEMATARGQYSDAMSGARRDLAGASSTARGQDIGLATDQARIRQQQTALNDARAQQYEQLQNKVASDQLAANVEQQRTAAGYRQHSNTLNTQTQQANVDKDFDLFKGAVGAVGGLVGGVGKLLSDPGAKLPVMGSLSSLDLGGGKKGVGGGVDIGGAGSMTSGMVQTASTGLGGDNGGISGMVGGGGVTGGGMDLNMPSDMVGKYTPSDMAGKSGSGALSDILGGMGGGLQSWAGGRDTMTSDEAAKRAAFEKGAAYATKQITGEEMQSWSSDDRLPGGLPRYRVQKQEPMMPPDTVAEMMSGYVAPSGPNPLPLPPPAGRRSPVAFERDKPAKPVPSGDWLDDFRARRQAELHAENRKGTGPVVLDFSGRDGGREMKSFERESSADEVDRSTAESPASSEKRKSTGTSSDAPRRKRNMSSSDENAKDPLPLYEPEGKQLHQSVEGRAFYADDSSGDDSRPSLAGPTPRYSEHPPVERRASKAEGGKPKARKMTPEELSREAERLGREMRSEHEQRMQQGPAVKERFGEVPTEAMADAARSMQPSPYAYKESMRPPEQAPGEVNVGPMANEMALDPVARTAIVRDPETGMLAIDKDKGLKVVMGSLASLQEQVDSMKNDVPRAARAKKTRRRGDSAQP